MKWGRAGFAYYDNDLIDYASRVILDVAAAPARFRQEALAARRMLKHLEQLGLRPEGLGADKAAAASSWRGSSGIQPHISLIDRRHQTGKHFTREQFRYAADENTYYCPEGQPLCYRGLSRTEHGYIYGATEAQCRKCLSEGKAVNKCSSGQGSQGVE